MTRKPAFSSMLKKDHFRLADFAAIFVLVVLWLLFFWRLFTPIEGDQASLVNGDFSGQFVAFGAYQYQRFAAGQVPLWDPYNNGGLPFIADTQAAVFYPPRLVTIYISKLAGGWSYHALELEMTVHVLAYSLMMYALVRRLTLKQPGSVLGAFVAAVVVAYSGYLSAYPPLQLALLEAGIWLPLAVFGILEATRPTKPGNALRWRWLLVTGLALGLSWMAGHPQTSWFLTYLLVAYFAYRVVTQRYSLTPFVAGILVFGAMAFGIAAVQLVPGLEYLARTARVDLTFDAKGTGFLFQDIIQFIFPGVLGYWSPLFVGIGGLMLALIAVWRKLPSSRFWGLVALVALLLSVGAHSPFFDALYNLLPGLRFFRGQERAVYLVSNSLAILAGMGAAHIVTWNSLYQAKAVQRVQQALTVLLGVCTLIAAVAMIYWLNQPQAYSPQVNNIAFSAIIAGTLLFVFAWFSAKPAEIKRQSLLAGLLVFELFTVNMHNSNYKPIPPSQELSLTPPPLVAQVVEDKNLPFRVDGYRALHDNYGSLYDVMDMRGISPLFLDSAYRLIETDPANHITPLAWELFAVRYVYSDWNELPVPSTIIAKGQDRYGAVNLHQLSDPRPFALLTYNVAVADSDEFARALLADPNFRPRQTVILDHDPGIPLNQTAPAQYSATISDFQPEQFTIAVNTPIGAVLSVSNPDYPGWRATLDDASTPIFRAYGALSAVVVPAGEHTVRFIYDPLSYRIGAILSLFTWGALGILVVLQIIRSKRWQPPS